MTDVLERYLLACRFDLVELVTRLEPTAGSRFEEFCETRLEDFMNLDPPRTDIVIRLAKAWRNAEIGKEKEKIRAELTEAQKNKTIEILPDITLRGLSKSLSNVLHDDTQNSAAKFRMRN